MIQFKSTTKTIICIGTGGVGKTTLAASLAIGKASEGKNILVLTIDPSLRLAQALGIKTDGELHQIQSANIAKSGGSLLACVINHEKAFQDFILQASENTAAQKDIQKILQNKLYKQVSTKLSGSQEFTSLYKLNQYVESGKYDLVILDTPPAQHTWHFLHAPEKIAQLFNEGVAKWFRDPHQSDISFMKKVFNIGTQQVLKALEVLTGAEFIKELSLFFKAVQNWQGPLERQVHNCQRLLSSPQTEFVLVTMPDPSRISESQKISREITKEGFNLTALVINKIPSWLDESAQITQGKILDYKKYYLEIQLELSQNKARFLQNLLVYKSFEVSQNDLHVDGLEKIYKNIQRLN